MARKPKYTEEEIKVFVENYVKEHINEKLKFETLYQEMGMSKASAYRQPFCGILKNEIFKYNFAPAKLDSKVRKEPVLSEIMDKCKDDPVLLKNELCSLYDLMKQRELGHSEIVASLEERINELKKENETICETLKKTKLEFDTLLDKYNYFVTGKDTMIRLDNNLAKTKKNSFREQFKELFGND